MIPAIATLHAVQCNNILNVIPTDELYIKTRRVKRAQKQRSCGLQ